MPRQRKFGKRRYDFVATRRTKKTAEQDKDYWKKHGWVVRITKGKRKGRRPQYAVWKAWKK